MNAHNQDNARPADAGFTLVEVLVAIVVLVFGLIAVTNLLLVGASNNTAANLGTAATAAAAQRMETLKAVAFNDLAPGTGTEVVDMPRTAPIQVSWTIDRRSLQLYFITVTAEGIGPMVAARSRSTLTSFRSCTAETAGCPPPVATPPPTPTPTPTPAPPTP
jgi:prepilin-type N-terminal cleavage/methylation domain-containing protein